jgi:hypothetical protein
LDFNWGILFVDFTFWKVSINKSSFMQLMRHWKKKPPRMGTFQKQEA